MQNTSTYKITLQSLSNIGQKVINLKLIISKVNKSPIPDEIYLLRPFFAYPNIKTIKKCGN